MQVFPACEYAFPPHVAAVGCGVFYSIPYLMFCWIVYLRAKLRLSVQLKVSLPPHLEKLSGNIIFSHMSTQLLEPGSIALLIHISFFLEELFHFRLGHFLGLAPMSGSWADSSGRVGLVCR